MAHAFPSAEWVEALVTILNEDPRYGQVARSWEGDLVFDILPDAETRGTADGVQHIYLDLWHGKCRRAAYHAAGSRDVPSAAFTMSATHTHFLHILAGDLDPMQAMLTRKLQVIGNMGYVLRNVPVVLDFVRCCRRVELEPRPAG
jgi:putative sterol carrier protein